MLQKLADELGPRGLDLVTVALDGSPQRASRMARKAGLRAPILVGDTALRKDFQVASYPWTLIVGRDGKALTALRGYHVEADLRQAMEKAL